MSGFVGVLRLDAKPVDSGLVQRLTRFLRFRGPDGEGVWVRGSVGLGHRLLRTTWESVHESQPLTLDGQVWLVADARIDGREALIRELRREGRQLDAQIADSEIVLHAYHAWGTRLVDRLLGDFAFAIWDGQAQRLFCARDCFGVKPFFYAHCEDSLIFGNTLDCVRRHPSVSAELNDSAIADFLLFGLFRDVDATAFENVARLPPAHVLLCERGTVSCTRYWSPTQAKRIRYKRGNEYAEHFLDRFEESVNDRLRVDTAAIALSGGLDSTAIAALAVRSKTRTHPPLRLMGNTAVYRRLFDDPEGPYANLAARALGIPIKFICADDYGLFQDFDGGGTATPEPYENPFLALSRDYLGSVGRQARVLLHGKGGDELLRPECLPRVAGLLPWNELTVEVFRTLRMAKRRPYLCLRSRFGELLGKGRFGRRDGFPAWISPALDERLHLRGRWEDYGPPKERFSRFVRRNAVEALTGFGLPHFLESMDPGVTRLPLEGRFPFLDRRLVEDLLAFPPISWFTDKQILRVAMRGLLPSEILTRKKTALVAIPTSIWLERPSSSWVDAFKPHPTLHRYVRTSAIPKLVGANLPWAQSELNLRPVALSLWFEQVDRPSEATSER